MIRRQHFWQAVQHGQSANGRSPAWVALRWFWAMVLGVLLVGAAVLQVLGPPPPRQPLTASAPATPAPTAPVPAPAPEAPATPRPPPLPPRAAANGIPAPFASLQEPAPWSATETLPRIGLDGRMPMQAYAAPFDASDPRPRVAVLLAGLGMAEIDSEEAIRATPPAVSLAISPYAQRPGRLVELARSTGHETLVSIPMEPLGYPLNDAGIRSLLTGLSPSQNYDNLVWALSRIGGYVGATAAMSGLRGERFAASPQMKPVLEELAARGLLYIDPRPVLVRPGGPSLARPGMRVADLVIDETPARSEIEARLAQLEQMARDRGTALGVAGLPAPVTIDRLAAWTANLASRGVVLVPVSALVPAPASQTAPGRRR